MLTEATLIGGPQDGARVKGVGGELPLRVHVGPKWLGDGYSAWSRKPSRRFPAVYIYDGPRGFAFLGWQTDPAPGQTPPEPCKG
jgi:hypothetical protein